jgi:hypothetical protein
MESSYDHEYRQLLDAAEEALNALLDETGHNGLIHLRRGLGEIYQAIEAEDGLARLREQQDRLEEMGREDHERCAAIRAKLDAPAAFQEQLKEINALPLTSTDAYGLEYRPDGPVSGQLMVIPRVLGRRRLPALSGLTLLDLAARTRVEVAGEPGVGPAAMLHLDSAMREHGLWYRGEADR